MPSRKYAFIALVAFAGLLAFIILSRPKSTEQNTVLPTPQMSLLSLSVEKVKQVKLSSTGITFQADLNQDGSWQSGSSSQTLDSQSLAALIANLCATKIQRELPADSVASDFGLDPAQYSLELQTSDGQTILVDIGSYNPDGSKLYARLHGQKQIYLIYSSDIDQLLYLAQMPQTITVEGTATPAK